MKSRRKGLLSGLVDLIDWTQIQGEGYLVRKKLMDDQIHVTFCKAQKKDPAANQVRIRLGRDVIEELKWEAGDRLVPLYNPDDLMTFLIVKSETGGGFSLQKESGVQSCRFYFKWTNKDFPLVYMPSTPVDYEIHKGKLIFRIERDTEK